MQLSGTVQELHEHKGRICREILTELPGWFGIPEAVDQYAKDAEQLPMFGFVTAEGRTQIGRAHV